MSDQQFQQLLPYGIGLCAFMIIISLLKVKSRGPSAYMLALGFVCFGTLLAGFRFRWSAQALGLVGVAIAGCLIGDVILRLTRGPNKP